MTYGKVGAVFSNSFVASPTSQLILQPFLHFTYVTAHSITLPLLHLRHITSPMSPGEPPYSCSRRKKIYGFCANFDTSNLYAVCHVLLLVYDVQYVTISMCRLGVGKTIKNIINTRKGWVLGPFNVNSAGPWLGYRRGVKYAGETSCS